MATTEYMEAMCMNKKLVMLEPKGYYELDVCHFINPGSEYISYLLISGEGDIPVPECSDIGLVVYQARGYEVRDAEELEELQEEASIPHIPADLGEWVRAAIEWYEQRGFTAEHIESYAMVSALE